MSKNAFKYSCLEKLSLYLGNHRHSSTLTLTFTEIEEIIEAKLPHNAKHADAKQVARWWHNRESNKQSNYWMSVGFRTVVSTDIRARGNVRFSKAKESKVDTEDIAKKNKNFLTTFWYALSRKDAPNHQRAVALSIILGLVISSIPIGFAVFSAFSSPSHESDVTIFATFNSPSHDSDVSIDSSMLFDEIMSQANFELTNMNFIESARLYNQAYQLAFCAETRISAWQRKGTSFLLYGYLNSDMHYLSQSILINRRIVNANEIMNTEYFIHAITDIIFAHYLMNQRHDYPKLVRYVNLLKEKHCFEDDFSSVGTDLTVATVLGLYYRRAYRSNPVYNLRNTNYMEYALYYFRRKHELRTLNTDLRGVNLFIQNDFFISYSIANFILNYYFLANLNDPSYEKLAYAVELSRYALEGVDAGTEKWGYVALRRTIGKGYLFMSFFAYDDVRYVYFDNIFDNIRPLIFWPLQENYEIERQILIATSYLLMTNSCTEDDIYHIVNRIENGLEVFSTGITPTQRARLAFMSSGTLISIIYNYEYLTDRVLSILRPLLTELNTSLYSFLGDDFARQTVRRDAGRFLN